jgi:hypothetical protein
MSATGLQKRAGEAVPHIFLTLCIATASRKTRGECKYSKNKFVRAESWRDFAPVVAVLTEVRDFHAPVQYS